MASSCEKVELPGLVCDSEVILIELFSKKLQGGTRIVPRWDFESSLDGWSDGMPVGALAVRMSLFRLVALSFSQFLGVVDIGLYVSKSHLYTLADEHYYIVYFLTT